MKKVMVVCGSCWGTNVSATADVVWDVSKQEWVVDNVQDNDWCMDCEENCCMDTVELDDKGEPMFPSVDEVISSGDAAHMLARAKYADMNKDAEGVQRLFHALLENKSCRCAIELAAYTEDCDHKLVEELLIEQRDNTAMRYYIETVLRADMDNVVKELIAIATSTRNPEIIRPFNSGRTGLNNTQELLMNTIYKLLGGTK